MSKSILYKFNLYSICLLAFALPLLPKLIPVFIILVSISSLINGDYKNLRKKNKSILLFSSLFVIYAISMLYSDNIKFGLKDLETKLSLVVFPIIFFISKLDFKKYLSQILKWFVLGIITAIVICLIDALYQFITTGEESELFYGKLSTFLHPGYFSLYVNLALMICLEGLIKKEGNIILNRKFTFFLLCLFAVMIILLSSKTGILTMLLSCSVGAFYWIKKTKAYLKSVFALIILSIALITTYSYSYSFKVRIDEVFKTITADNKSHESTSIVRMEAWKTSINLILNNPVIGYGVGDSKDILMQSYKDNNLPILYEKQLNPHNQFLQVLLSIGVIGFVTFILILLLPSYYSIKNKNYLYFFFILLFIFNLLTECMLERLAGVIFFAFFQTLFFAAYFNPSKNIEE